MESNIPNMFANEPQIVDPFKTEQPISNQEVSVNEVNPGFMDVAKIQEQATDINIEKPQADLDTLLKPSEFKIEIDPEEELQNEEPIRNGKFFNFGEESKEEVANDYFNKLNSQSVAEPAFLQPTSNNEMNPSDEIPLENLKPIGNATQIEEIKPSEKIVSISELDKPAEPKFDSENYNNYDYDFDEEIKLEKPIVEEQPITQASLKDAIGILRECSDKLSNLGFKVDLEEFDFDDMYQAIFKIDKK